MQDKKTKKDQPVRKRVVDKETIALASQIVKKEKTKFTDKQKKILKEEWSDLRKLEVKFWKDVTKIEKQIQKKTKIKDTEFFWVNGDCLGIGNVSKTMELVASYELEKKGEK